MNANRLVPPLTREVDFLWLPVPKVYLLAVRPDVPTELMMSELHMLNLFIRGLAKEMNDAVVDDRCVKSLTPVMEYLTMIAAAMSEAIEGGHDHPQADPATVAPRAMEGEGRTCASSPLS